MDDKHVAVIVAVMTNHLYLLLNSFITVELVALPVIKVTLASYYKTLNS